MSQNVISANVTLCLMMIQENGDYIPSEPMSYDYFFLVLDAFTSDLAESSKQLMYQVYQQHYRDFKIREPNDLNYIAVVSVIPKVLTPDEITLKPWLSSKVPVWEPSNCIVVADSGFQKVDPNYFADIIAGSQ